MAEKPKGLQEWTDRIEGNPAAPAGLQQGQKAAAGVVRDDPAYEGSGLGKWLNRVDSGPTGAAQSWFTGANNEGTDNGWSTEFLTAFRDQREAAAEQGYLATFFDRDDATGVVLYDHESEDKQTQYKFGDVYENGKKTGNLYDLYDKDTANLMVSPFLLDADEQKAAFSGAKFDQPKEGLRNKKLDDMLLEKRELNDESMGDWASAQDHEALVTQKELEYSEGVQKDATILGGAGGGAVIGAGLGSVVPFFGTAAGAIGGGVIGAGAAWLNQDSLLEQLARAEVTSEQAEERFNDAAAFSTRVTQYSRFGMKLFTPTSNLVQGGVDWAGKSKIGDGTADFYRVNDKGERGVSKLVIGLDIASTVVDSALQFATPLGLLAYSGLMSGTVSGQVGELTLNGGHTFNARSGRFENIFVDETQDEDGNVSRSFDWGSAAAGVGAIGIDAIQLGFARGLARKTDDMRAMVGQDATYGRSAAMMDGAAEKASRVMPKWLGGQSDKAAAAAARAEGGKEVRMGGYAYTLDDAGTAVSRRMTMTMLAPSEQLSGLGAKLIARRDKALAEGALSTDDIYRAARGMASGERRLTNAMVNGMGEAYEEGIQAALEPISHDANIDGAEMFLSAAYGFASGAGMAAGLGRTQPSSREVLESQAGIAMYMNNGGVMPDAATLKNMSDDELRVTAATMNKAQSLMAKKAREIVVDEMTGKQSAGVAGLNKVLDAMRTVVDADLAKAEPRTDGVFVVTPMEATGRVDADGNVEYGSVASNAVVSSARQMWLNILDGNAGLEQQIKGLRAELEDAQAGDQADPDIAARVAKAAADVAEAEQVKAMHDRMVSELKKLMDKLYKSSDPAERAANVAAINHQLRLWFDMEDGFLGTEALDATGKRHLARAVSQMWIREPRDSGGSFQMLVPQISLQLHVARADNVLQVSSGILKAIRGDHDGDKLRPLTTTWLDADAFLSARSGSFMIGAGDTVHIAGPKNEKYVLEAIANAHSTAATNPALAAEATAYLTRIGSAIKKRYSGQGVDADIDKVLQRFYDAANSGLDDARGVLLDGLADKVGSAVTEVGHGNLSNEWLWIDQVVKSNLDTFQEVYVAHTAVPGEGVNDLGLKTGDKVTGLARSRKVNERLGRAAATAGQTMQLLLQGESPFRMFQKLHYGDLSAPVLTADGREVSALEDLAMLYEQLGQNMTQTELERIQGEDDITGKVLVALERLADSAVQHTVDQAALGNGRALSKHEAVVLLANTAVRDFDDNGDGNFTMGSTISLAQMLLKLQVKRDQKEKAAILESSPSLKSKHARLLGMTRPGGGQNRGTLAEEAFVEVFGRQPIGALLGVEADVFGPQVTLEQYVRQYSSMSIIGRRDKARELKSQPGYLGRESTRNIPYDVAEIATHEVSPYRSVLDSILAVGNGRVTFDPKTKTLKGEYADRSQKVSENFTEAMKSIRLAMAELIELKPKHLESRTDLIERALATNPDFARKVFDLVPNSAASFVFEVVGDDVIVNNWFYEMLAEPNAKKAEMIYWRNVLLETWRAKALNPAKDKHGREYDQLDRRMHRIMYRLEREGGPLQELFLQQLATGEDVNEFVAWVNATPGLLFNEAPIVPWFDDVAEFDADKANGGWTTALDGAELREAIKTLKGAAENLHTDLVEERQIFKADQEYLRAIERVAKGEAKDGDQAIYDALADAIRRAGERYVALGPAAMVFQATANAWGFYGKAHNKGTNPAHVEALGMFDARRDAFDFVHNFNRTLGALTSVDLEAVGANLSMVAKGAGRAMDAEGNVVEWELLTPEQMAELLANPDTRKYARGMLFPTVLERTDEGYLSEQMLVGKTLENLLSGKTYDELFGAFDKLPQDQAFKYLAMVEAQARKYGAHLPISRMVNDLVIARLQGAKQSLDVEDVEAMVVEAYYQVAQLLQESATVAAADMASGSDMLEQTRKELKLQAQQWHLRGRQGAFAVKPGDEVGEAAVDVALQEFRDSMEFQRDYDLELIAEQRAEATTQEELDALDARQARVIADYADFIEKVDSLKELDVLGPVIAAWSLPEQGEMSQADYLASTYSVQRKLIQYVDTHPEMVSRVPQIMQVLSKVQLNPDKMKTDDWDELSRAVIALELIDAAGPVGQGVSVRLFPGEKNIGERRYYDPTYSYLLDDVLNADSAMVKAAVDLHFDAKRYTVSPDLEKVKWLVNERILDRKKLGPWSEEVVIASVEANQRIDSAAAAPAISISGQSPKNEATVSAATERTLELPDDTMYSTVTMSASQLEDGHNTDLVDMVFPGGKPVKRPRIQLNNRFARSVVMTGPGLPPEGIDLLAENPDLGRRWLGKGAAVSPAAPGAPREIHTDRIAEAMVKSAKARQLDPRMFDVTVEFLHPETQPVDTKDGRNWYNNLWFEGTSFKLDADRHGSLNETLWFALGSLSPEGQATALDASKSGLQAMQVIAAPTAAERALDEDGFETDLAAVLHRKTMRILDTDLGFGKLDPEMYNAVLKNVKLRHFVLVDGDVLSAEQAIAKQQAGEVLTDAKLWTPSDRVLRTFLGEIGSQGAARITGARPEFDVYRIPRYRGVTDAMKTLMAPGLAGGTKKLEETAVVHRGRQITLKVRPMLTRRQRDQYAAKYRWLSEDQLAGHLERGDMRDKAGGFNPTANLQRAVQSAFSGIRAENMTFAFEALGLPFPAPRELQDKRVSEVLLKDLHSVIAADDRRTGWVLRHNAVDSLDGTIGKVELGSGRKGFRILMGDLVSVEVDSFGEDREAAMKQLKRLADKGATIVLADPSGGSSLRAELAAYTRSLGYERIAGSDHAFRPLEASSEYVTQIAREDTLMEVRGITPQNRVAVFNTNNVSIQEGGAYLTGRLTQNNTLKVVSDLVPVSSVAGFGVPQRQERDNDQIDLTIRHLQGLNTASIQKLKDAAHAKLKGKERRRADKSFDRAWKRMMARFDDASNGTVLPTYDDGFEIGDMIPLIDNANRLLIYRHGMKRPDRADLEDMWNTPLIGGKGSNVAVYSGKLEPAASVHEGKPVEFRPRPGYGLTVEMEVPLQAFGDKRQLQWDGTKYTIVSLPDAKHWDEPGVPVLPDHTFFEGWDIGLVSDLDTRLGKQGTEAMVNTHRNAFAFFGINFELDVAETFFPGVKQASPAEQQKAITATRMILRSFQNTATKISVRDVVAIQDMPLTAQRWIDQFPASMAESFGLEANWSETLANNTSVESQITLAVLQYLSLPGADLDHVLKSGSFDDTTAGPDSMSVLMPSVFTRVFDKAPIGSPLRKELNLRFNAQINRVGAKPGQGYRLMENFDFVVDSGIPGKRMVGILSFPEVHSSGDNPITNGMSYQPGQKQDISAHSSMVTAQAIGGRQLHAKGLKKAKAFQDQLFSREGAQRLQPGVYDDGAVSRMLSDIPAKDRSFQWWSMPLPAEIERRGLAYDAMVGFRKEIKREGEGWTSTEAERFAAQYDEVVSEILTMANLPRSLTTVVDGWVRQMSGRPADMVLSDGTTIEPLSAKAALEWARDIRDNVQRGDVPVMGGYVPLLHVHDLKLLFNAQQTARLPWKFKGGEGVDMTDATTWDDWVNVSLGASLASGQAFERFYLLPTDGFMHSYQNASRDTTELPISLDTLTTNQILSVKTNVVLDRVSKAEIKLEVAGDVSSIDPYVQRLVTDPIALDTARAELRDLLNGHRIAGEYRGEAPPASEKAKHEKRLRRYRRENDMATPVVVSMRDYRKNGQELLHHTTTANAFTRGLINLRVGMALFNPALYVSMPIEQGIRGSLDRAVNLLTGQATTGLTARLQAKAGVSATTSEQQAGLVRLFRKLGADPNFKSMLYGDLMYQRPFEPGSGRVSRALENFAKAGSRMQDPTWGMRGDTLARRYLEAVLWNLQRAGTNEGIGIDRLIAELDVNPTFLRDHMPGLHQAGTNRVADIRSLKPTLLSQTARWMYEPLSQNPHSPAANMFGNIVLRLPMIFAGYAGNVATSILGLQGLDQFTAAVLDGRKKGPLSMFGRIAAKLEGKEFSPEDDARFDMSSIIEGIDLSRAFLQGGLTHTGLFAFGLMAGSLGLGGEDDEEKRMRRAAELQGTIHVYDPLKVQNDWRNHDALFLDWLPFGLDSYFVNDSGRAMADMHWMLKQFISPLMGMEKFLQTGNFQHVKWGFADALGAFPLINTNTFADAMETAALFEKAAAESSLEGTEEAQVKAAGFLIMAVGAYEKMLFENSFASALYVGLDELDRDPYAEVMTNSDGVIQRDALRNPRHDETLEQVVDPETGEVRTVYQSRTPGSIEMAVMTENRPFMALVASAFGDDYWRYNMVPKIREMEKPVTTRDQAEFMVLAALRGQGAKDMPGLSTEEAMDILKKQYRDRGEWYDESELEPIAKRMSADSGGGVASLLTEDKYGEFFDADKDKARGIFKGLYQGTADVDAPEFANLYIGPELRNEIQKDWMKELVAEGVSMGLSEKDATDRMERLWWGPLDNPDVRGIGEILWDNRINYSSKQRFYQLNTTYVMGPDGRPWATGYRRDAAKGVGGFFGAALSAGGVLPLQRLHAPASNAVGADERLNTTDLVNNMNTGLRALMPMPESPPTDEEIGKSIEEAIKEAKKADYSPFTPFAQRNGSGSGWVNFGRRGYGGGSRRYSRGGGGYSSSGYPNFSKMYALPSVRTPYGSDIPFINTNNPILRRANVRRERVWSERGRLNQWQ